MVFLPETVTTDALDPDQGSFDLDSNLKLGMFCTIAIIGSLHDSRVAYSTSPIWSNLASAVV